MSEQQDNITIRLAKPGDLLVLARVFLKAYSAYDKTTLAESWTLSSAQKLLEFFYLKQKDLFFVAEEKGRIVGGVVMIVKPWWDGNRLIDGEFFVSPNKQRKGIGSMLLYQLFVAAKKKHQVIGCDTNTLKKSKHPLSFYKKIGFKENKDLTFIYGNVDILLAHLADEYRNKTKC